MFSPSDFSTATCGAVVLLVASVGVAQAPAGKQTRKLVWQDEFDGDSLDYSRWEIEVNAFGGGNHELQILTASIIKRKPSGVRRGASFPRPSIKSSICD